MLQKIMHIIAPGVTWKHTAIGWEDLTQVVIIGKVKERPKVLIDNIIKEHLSGKSYWTIAEPINIHVTMYNWFNYVEVESSWNQN